MMFEGNHVQLEALDDNILSLRFDARNDKVNVLGHAALQELRQAVDLLKQQAGAAGLVLCSAKGSFILGADIKEFLHTFAQPEQTILDYLGAAHAILNDIEDLPFPTVAAINGDALGGGCEIALSADFRVMTTGAQIGLPETKLGIIPGFGGTVRLPRLIGVDNALEWIAGAKNQSAGEALAVGAVDSVVEDAHLLAGSLHILTQCRSGKFDWQARRRLKSGPLQLVEAEAVMAFESARALIFSKAGTNFPAPMAAVDAVQKGAARGREEALRSEAEHFVQLAKTDVCRALVGLFLNSQLLKRQAREASKDARPVRRSAVLGAGIMGGGIAYQSALKGIPVTLKDIDHDALDKGLEEAARQLHKRIERNKLDDTQALKVMGTISTTLNMSELGEADLVVEAVVEKADIKSQVLAEAEQVLADEAIITTNTSTLSIDGLAKSLKRPQRFCGMHFFNPVPVMPLVEVIRGKQTSPATLASVVAYAAALGKTPVVVNDCPGFFVNRVLFPYLFAFNLLLKDGVDFRRIDSVMERFGWPMGPAYLQDVVGIDTCCHGMEVMAEGYPDRMSSDTESAPFLLLKAQRLGQKNGKGFYQYIADKKSRQAKAYDADVEPVLAPLMASADAEAAQSIRSEDIIARMMLPLCIEVTRCLEEGIIASASEADMALIMGLGFPTFRGGALRYLDTLGLAHVCELSDRYAALGPLYQPTETLRRMAREGKAFFE